MAVYRRRTPTEKVRRAATAHRHRPGAATAALLLIISAPSAGAGDRLRAQRGPVGDERRRLGPAHARRPEQRPHGRQARLHGGRPGRHDARLRHGDGCRLLRNQLQAIYTLSGGVLAVSAARRGPVPEPAMRARPWTFARRSPRTARCSSRIFSSTGGTRPASSCASRCSAGRRRRSHRPVAPAHSAATSSASR